MSEAQKKRKPEISRTHHASQAVQLSDLLELKFAAQTFGTEVKRKLRISQPDGPSTDGGRQARQVIVLASDTAPTIVCGYLSVKQRMAEFKNYAVIDQVFRARHGRPVDISRGEYDRMIEVLQDELRTQGYDVHVAAATREATRSSLAPQRAPPQNTSLILAAAVGLLAGFGLGFAVGFVTCSL